MRLTDDEFHRMEYLLGKYKATSSEFQEEKELKSLIDKNCNYEAVTEDLEGHVYRGLIMVGAHQVLQVYKDKAGK